MSQAKVKEKQLMDSQLQMCQIIYFKAIASQNNENKSISGDVKIINIEKKVYYLACTHLCNSSFVY